MPPTLERQAPYPFFLGTHPFPLSRGGLVVWWPVLLFSHANEGSPLGACGCDSCWSVWWRRKLVAGRLQSAPLPPKSQVPQVSHAPSVVCRLKGSHLPGPDPIPNLEEKKEKSRVWLVLRDLALSSLLFLPPPLQRTDPRSICFRTFGDVVAQLPLTSSTLVHCGLPPPLALSFRRSPTSANSRFL